MATDKRLPLYIFILTLITRVGGAALGGVRADDSDGCYRSMADSFLAGHGLSIAESAFGRRYSWLPPGMGVFYLLFYSTIGKSIIAERCTMVLLSASTNLVLHRLGRTLLGGYGAALASLAWALYPPQWFWGSRINPHTLCTDMVVVAVFLFLVGLQRKNLLLSYSVGVLWAAISLTRGEYVLGIAIFAFSAFLAHHPFKIRAGLAAACLLGWATLLGGWMIRNYRIHHAFILVSTADGDNIWKAYNPNYNFSGNDIAYPPELMNRLLKETNDVTRSRILKQEAWKFIRQNPGRALRNAVGNTFHFWRPWLSAAAASVPENVVYVISYFPFFIFFVMGLLKLDWGSPAWFLIAGLVFYKWLIHIPFYVIVVQREVMAPLMILVACIPFLPEKPDGSHA